MCMKASEEGCVLKEQQAQMREQIAAIDGRLTQVEHDVGRMRSESQDAFRALNSSVDNLAHDFGQRMNALDARIVAEKEAWGVTLRSVVLWTVRVVLAGCAVAMGITAYRSLFRDDRIAARQDYNRFPQSTTDSGQ